MCSSSQPGSARALELWSITGSETLAILAQPWVTEQIANHYPTHTTAVACGDEVDEAADSAAIEAYDSYDHQTTIINELEVEHSDTVTGADGKSPSFGMHPERHHFRSVFS